MRERQRLLVGRQPGPPKASKRTYMYIRSKRHTKRTNKQMNFDNKDRQQPGRQPASQLPNEPHDDPSIHPWIDACKRVERENKGSCFKSAAETVGGVAPGRR
eukprot:GHVU01215696.1.p1 GENE.GHVU01215696.1~~GHVU01215696.1.p1  ORF type:complete len:102 (-),score=9.74 GHVU01215696.1:223-528(-)